MGAYIFRSVAGLYWTGAEGGWSPHLADAAHIRQDASGATRQAAGLSEELGEAVSAVRIG